MTRILQRLCGARALGSEAGATAVEYAIMLALIAIVVATAVAFLGESTNEAFNSFQLPT